MTGSRLRVGGLALAAFIASFALASQAQAPAAAVAQAPAAPVAGGRGQAAPLPPQSITCTDLAAALRAVNANDARLRDWPQIGRYHDANRSVAKADVVFMGDSITDFWVQPRFG